MSKDFRDPEDDHDWEEDEYIRVCDHSCPHYDQINGCCWQTTEKGLCFSVNQFDLCHLGYKDER